jgi:RHS repeat-associated protein
VYTDHLGSVDVITNAAGLQLEKLSFDAFGKRRQVYTAGYQVVAFSLASILDHTNQGFTGHLQVDHASIVHMGGRIYDSHIGRFMQADPFVQAPTDSQNHNRYSYVLNNPLSYTDPSGYFFSKLWKELKPFIGAIVAVVGTALCPACSPMLIGALAGAAGAAVNGGNILQGAVIGAFSAHAFGAVGQEWAAGTFGNVMGNAVVGGIMNSLQGGKFGHGFFAAGFSSTFKTDINKIGGGEASHTAHRIVAAAVVGGTASKISGGKFANGAVTGAFSQAFNGEPSLRRKLAEESVKDHQKMIDRVLSERMRLATVNEMELLNNMSLDELRSLYMGQGFEGITDQNLRLSRLEGISQLQRLAHQLNAGNFVNSDAPIVLNGTPLGSVGQAAGILMPSVMAILNPIGSSLWWHCSSACTIQSVHYADKHINRTIRP